LDLLVIARAPVKVKNYVEILRRTLEA
jgi:hypothetical protein